MRDFKAKMHQIRFQLWLHPSTPLGEAYRPPSWILGQLCGRGGLGWEEEGKAKGRGGRRKWSEEG